jgi:hypothetical protein
MAKRRSKPGKKVLFFIFFISLVLVNVFAEDNIKTNGQVPDPDSADAGPLGDDSLNKDYRQKLQRVVAEAEEELPQDWETYTRFMPASGAKSQSGKVSVVDTASEYNYTIKAFGKLPVEFGLATKYIAINNKTAIKLPAHLTTVGFGMETTLPLFEIDKTYITIGITPLFSSDNWNFNSSSFCLHQRYFLIRQQSEKLVFIAGVDVYPGQQDEYYPILGFIYKPDERLTFTIIPDHPEISYLVNEKLTVFIEGGGSSDEFNVKKEDLKNVALTYDEMHAGCGLRYKWNKHLKGSLSCGSVFNRSIAYDQDSLGKVALENGFYTEFRFEVSI